MFAGGVVLDVRRGRGAGCSPGAWCWMFAFCHTGFCHSFCLDLWLALAYLSGRLRPVILPFDSIWTLVCRGIISASVQTWQKTIVG